VPKYKNIDDIMIQSMTGYGKTVVAYKGKKINVEIKSLNSKQLDLTTRIAPLYREKEMEIRQLIAEQLQRGKVEFAIWIEKDASTEAAPVNTALMDSYYRQLKGFAEEHDMTGIDWMQTLTRMPDVLTKTEVEVLDNEEWQAARQGVCEAVQALVDFRKQEGAALEKKFAEKIDNIESLLAEIEPFEKSRVEKIRLRIVDGLQQKRFFYDQKKASKVIRFCENFCRHHEGPLAPQLIRLELWQKAFLSVIFGIVDADGSRTFREIVLQIGRKNGKTLLAAAISAFEMFMDDEYGARLYFVAPKLDQSRLCFNAFMQMIMKEPELSDLAKKRRTDIYVASSNSSAQPLAFSYQKSDGLNPSLTVCDEIASWPGDPGLKQYEVLKSALGARRQPMLLSISTAGYVNDGIFDELIKRSTAVIMGTSKESRLAPFCT
jgi:uncharacterized protein (TIGR00255 family)